MSDGYTHLGRIAATDDPEKLGAYRCDKCRVCWLGAIDDKTFACPKCGDKSDYIEQASFFLDLADHIADELTMEDENGVAQRPTVEWCNFELPEDS